MGSVRDLELDILLQTFKIDLTLSIERRRQGGPNTLKPLEFHGLLLRKRKCIVQRLG